MERRGIIHAPGKVHSIKRSRNYKEGENKARLIFVHFSFDGESLQTKNLDRLKKRFFFVKYIQQVIFLSFFSALKFRLALLCFSSFFITAKKAILDSKFLDQTIKYSILKRTNNANKQKLTKLWKCFLRNLWFSSPSWPSLLKQLSAWVWNTHR